MSVCTLGTVLYYIYMQQPTPFPVRISSSVFLRGTGDHALVVFLCLEAAGGT